MSTMVLCMDKDGRCHVARREEDELWYWEDDRCGCCQLMYDNEIDIEWWQPIDHVVPFKSKDKQ